MMRAYELLQLVEVAIAEKGYGSMPVTIVLDDKIYSIKEITWCANYTQFHIHADKEFGGVKSGSCV